MPLRSSLSIREIRGYPFGDLADTPHEVKLLDKVQPLQDEVVERLETLRPPELLEVPLLAKVVPADHSAEKFIHQDVLQDDRAPDDLILGEFEVGSPGFGIGSRDNLIGIEPEGGREVS